MPPNTLRSWYLGVEPLLVPSAHLGKVSLLSFRDLEEAYKLYLLRVKFDFSFPTLREALGAARKATSDSHPLLNSDLRVFRANLVINLPARGRRREQTLQLSGPRQLTMREVVDTWGKRIDSGRTIFPWRFLKSDDDSRPVIVDPEVMSGRLVVSGTRIPVQVLQQRKASGALVSHLAKDYDIAEDLIVKALMHVNVQQKAA